MKYADMQQHDAFANSAQLVFDKTADGHAEVSRCGGYSISIARVHDELRYLAHRRKLPKGILLPCCAQLDEARQICEVDFKQWRAAK